MPHAAAGARAVTGAENHLTITSSKPTGLSWKGPAAVNGRSWPAADDATVWLPAGRHVVTPAESLPAARLLYLNADLLNATVTQDAIEFEYRSRTQAIALLDIEPRRILVDGEPAAAPVLKATKHFSLLLPKGTHKVRVVVTGLLP
jgi:hypothetical protein